MALTIPNLADAAFPAQAEPDAQDVAALVAGFAGTGVLSGCAVTAQGSPDMTVAVAAGTVVSVGAQLTVTSGNVTIAAADATNPRFDLIVADSTGTKQRRGGTAAASPVFPAPTAGDVLLAAVYVPAGDTAIGANQITDKRVMLAEPLILNVRAFGALGDGSANDTAAFSAAHAALPSAGGIIFVPPATYQLDALTFTKPVHLMGVGAGTIGGSPTGSLLRARSATATLLTFSGTSNTIEGLSFNSVDGSALQTAGAYIHLSSTAQFSTVLNVQMQRHYVGVRMSGAQQAVRRAFLHTKNVTSGSADILIDAGLDHLIDEVIIDGLAPAVTSAGIRVTATGGLRIDNSDISHAGIGLEINAAAATCQAIYVAHTYVDLNELGVKIAPSGSNLIEHLRFNNMWSASSEDVGFDIDEGSGKVMDVQFSNCIALANGQAATAGRTAGWLIGPSRRVRIIGGFASYNVGAGVHVEAGVSDWAVIGLRAGSLAEGAFNGPNDVGMLIDAGASDNYQVIGCDFRLNTTAAFTDGGTGINKQLLGNLPLQYPLASPPSLPPNAVINGNFDVWQRGTSFAAIADGAYFADCWSYHKVGAMVHTVSRNTTVPAVGVDRPLSNYSALIDCTTVDASIAAGDVCYIQHLVEGDDWKQLAQRPFSLSFWYRSPKTGIHCVAVQNSGKDRSYVAEFTVSAANTFEYKTVTIPASPSAGTWNYTNGIGLRVVFPLAAGTNFQGPGATWSSADDIATSNQQNLCDNAANDVYIAQVNLIAGAVAAPLAPYAIEAEWDRCQRRYEVHGGAIGAAPTYFAYAGSASEFHAYGMPFLTRKGGTPTMAKNGTWSVGNTSQPSADAPTPTGYRFLLQSVAAGSISATPADSTCTVTATWNPS